MKRQGSLFTLGVSLLLMGACGDGSGASEVGDPKDTQDTDTAGPYDTDFLDTEDTHRDANRTCFAHPPPPVENRLVLEEAFTHLAERGTKLRGLTALVPASADTFMVSVLGGQVLEISTDPAQTQIRTVLDLKDMLDFSSNENGLVSIALHPDFGTNGYLYAVYMVPTGTGRVWSRLGRFTRASDGTFERGSERILIDVEQRARTHHVNHIAFGPDGYLYASAGDDLRNQVANPSLTENAAQSLSSLQGKVWRIDVDGEEAGLPYAIPDDNPYVGVAGARGEVFAIGFRNPWRFHFGPDGSLYLGDVGQDAREEVDLVVAGGNYGWPFFEGVLCRKETACEDPTYLAPLVDYTLGGPRALVAGPVYTRGDAGDVAGRLIYGDYVLGHVWSVDPETPEPRLEVEGSFPISSFGQGLDGTIYALRYSTGGDGRIYSLVPAPPPTAVDTFPRRLSETGCFDPDDPRKVVEGVVPFRPAAELWSDGADKERFFAFPDNRQIEVDAEGDFEMPEGTVLIKHFGFDDRLHETRLLMHYNGRWSGYSYRWNEAQTDAELLDSQVTATLDNGVQWTWPSRSQCLTCHTEVAGLSLGLEVGQLDDQLDTLVADGWLDPGPDGVSGLRQRMPRLATPFAADGETPSASTGHRARSYLHANCAGCHQPGGLGRADIDLRIGTPFADTRLCDLEPKTSRVWDTPYNNWDAQRLLRPGSPEASILWLRLITPGYFRMPPLGSEVHHEAGVELVGDWIRERTECLTDDPLE